MNAPRLALTVGLDIGQLHDYTALAAIESRPQPTGGAVHHVVHLARWRGIPYTDVVGRVSIFLSQPEVRGRYVLVVDATGVGRAIVDMFNVGEVSPCCVTITGGEHVSGSYPEFSVPKRDLVSVIVATAQSGRLKVSRALPEGRLLEAEMLNFRVKLSKQTGHDSYEAWREGDHDDLVLAVGLGLWHAEFMGSAGVSWGGGPDESGLPFEGRPTGYPPGTPPIPRGTWS